MFIKLSVGSVDAAPHSKAAAMIQCCSSPDVRGVFVHAGAA
jgi:hypothetical protein